MHTPGMIVEIKILFNIFLFSDDTTVDGIVKKGCMNAADAQTEVSLLMESGVA